MCLIYLPVFKQTLLKFYIKACFKIKHTCRPIYFLCLGGNKEIKIILRELLHLQEADFSTLKNVYILFE